MKLRTSVVLFANEMEKNLLLNDHKGDWEGCSMLYLLRRLREETDELVVALEFKDEEEEPLTRENITKEAADVANFAMMIADNFGDLKKP